MQKQKLQMEDIRGKFESGILNEMETANKKLMHRRLQSQD